jgi:protein TonB
LNSLLLLGLIVWPLLHPLALPKQALAMLLIAPTPPAPAVPVVREASSPRTQVHSQSLAIQLQIPTRIPTTISNVADTAPPPGNGNGVIGSLDPGSGTGLPGGILDSPGTRPIPHVVAAVPKKIAISSGVMAGNKIAGADPTYPAIARSARIQGTVVLQATISKTGAIENLRVLSGPPMLVSSAIEAVRTWRYRPYQLNSEPVEVETTINVVFNLGS